MQTRRGTIATLASAGALIGAPRGLLAQEPSVPDVDLSGGLPVEREYVLADRPANPEMRDAVNVWIEEVNGNFGIRIGVEAVASAWEKQTVWLDVALSDGRVFSYRSEADPIHSPLNAAGEPMVRGAGPARFECVEPFKLWTAVFDGKAGLFSAQQLIDDPDAVATEHYPVEINVDLMPSVPPWVPGSMLPSAKEAMKGAQGEMISPRYEQLCRAKGTLRVGDGEFAFEGQALRIRRTGIRRLAEFWGHCWQSAVFPSGKAFGFNAFPPREDGKPSYAEAYIFEGEGKLIPARPVSIPWMRTMVAGDEHVPLVLETLDGRRIAIDGQSYVNVRSRSLQQVPPDFPIVAQSHGTYRWGDEKASGMMERSTLPSAMIL